MYFDHPPPPTLKRSLSGESKASTATDTSSVSRTSSKLLFGEIPLTPVSSADGRSTHSRSNSSICNLVLSTSSAFLRFWLSDECRDGLLSRLDRTDLPNLRLVCHDFSSRASPYLFSNMSVTFKPSTFTKPARMEALDRIGRHVKTFTFHMPHGRETFLAPIIDPVTGDERPFLYEPQIDPPVVVLGKDRSPKYGTGEMTELLLQQYPPLFHASTNVPAFVRAFSSLPNLSHLKISCPGYSPSLSGHRRTIVDYALISLRIAVERAPLFALSTLSLLPIHPGGLLYLHPLMGNGFASTRPLAKRWAQIRNLTVHMEGLPNHRGQEIEHFRILHAYLRTLSRSLSVLSFRWNGRRGPSPLSLDTEAPFQSRPPSREEEAIHPTLRPSNISALEPLHFPRLRHVEIENVVVDAGQISAFVSTHKSSLAEFNFKDVRLRRGDWETALLPLSGVRVSGIPLLQTPQLPVMHKGNEKKEWANTDTEQRTLVDDEDVMDCPLVLDDVKFEKPRTPTKPMGLRSLPEPRIVGPLMGEFEYVGDGNGFPVFLGVGRGEPELCRTVRAVPVSREDDGKKDGVLGRLKRKKRWGGTGEGVRRFLRRVGV